MTAPRRRSQPAEPGTVVAYIRVSTDEQVSSGAGLEAQRAAITAEADRRGWTIVGWYADEGISGGKGIEQRRGLAGALDAIVDAEAAVLMVAKTDRVARGLRTLLDVIDRAEAAGGMVVSIDGTVDTSTAAGRFQTQVMGSVAELERALISDRTKAALAVKRAQGVRLGRPSGHRPEVIARIVTARNRGESLPAIARALMADQVPTSQGGAKWYPSTVRAVLHSQDAERFRSSENAA